MMRIVAGLCLGLMFDCAYALDLYKCVSGGKITYSSSACASGTVTKLDVPPPAEEAGSPKATAKAEAELKRQMSLDSTLEKERLAREKVAIEEARVAARQAAAAAAAAKRNKQCDTRRMHKKWSDEEASRAAGPGSDKVRLKARRLAEQLAVECPA